MYDDKVKIAFGSSVVKVESMTVRQKFGETEMKPLRRLVAATNHVATQINAL